MRLALVLVLIAASLSLSCARTPAQPTGVGPSPAEGTPVPAATPRPSSAAPTPAPRGAKYGGVLTLANRGDPPAGFDPFLTSSIALHEVGGALFGPGNLVMRCRENMYLICPGTASTWEPNPGFTAWTFTIRDGVYWHDGTLFTAEDARFWFELAYFGAMGGGKTRAPAYFKGEFGNVENVEVLEHNRLRIKLRDRSPYLLDVLADPRFKIAHPRHLMASRIDRGEVGTTPLDVGLVGLGPFRFDAYERGSIIRVRRFNQYWERTAGGNLPYLDGIDYVIMPDPFAMDVAFRTGRLDGGARGQEHYLTAERKQGYVRDLGQDVFFAEMDGGNFRLAFNVLKPGPWQDQRVRRAMALWIDKRAAIPSALGGFGWTSPDLGAPNVPIPMGRALFINWPKFDAGQLEEKRAEAKRTIADAGYASGFSMGHLCRALNPVPCEFLKDQLTGLGINLQLQLVDEGEWNRARVSANYDSQEGRLTPSPIPEGTESVYGRYSKNPDAYAKHEDTAVDALYRRLRDALFPDQRVQVWREIEKYLFVEQSYIIPIAESVNVVAYRTYVKGLVIPTEDGHTHTDFATVWVDRKR